MSTSAALSPSSLSLSASAGSNSSSSSARLSDLCAADKAKVGRLLVKVAELQQRGQAGAALEAETRRLREEKDETERRLSRSLHLLKQYQDRLRAVELQAEADRGSEQEEEAAAQDSWQRQSADELASTQLELLRLLREQQDAVTRKLHGLPQALSAIHAFAAEAESGGMVQPHRSHEQREQQQPLPSAVTAALTASRAGTAASASSSQSSAALPSRSESQQSPHRFAPIKVSVRYVRSAALGPPAPQPRQSDRPARPASAVTPHSEKGRLQQEEESAEQEAADAEEEKEEEEEEGEEEAGVSRSSSPVSRRIQRLMEIQRGHQLQRPAAAAATAPSSSSSRLHRSHTPPLPSASRRPQPLPAGFSSSHPAACFTGLTPALLDAETEQLVLSLNGGSGRVSAHQPQRALSSLDVSLLRSLNPIHG